MNSLSAWLASEGIETISASRPWPQDAIEVAQILGPWGVRGAFRIKPYASDPQALLGTRLWYAQAPQAAAGAVAKPVMPGLYPCLLRIVQVKTQGEGWVASIKGIDQREVAEALKGARVFISRASFPSSDPDEFYWVDLLGLEVVNQEGVQLGWVQNLMSTGSTSVLEIGPNEPGAKAKHLVPFVAHYVLQVNLAERLIRVDWPEDFSQ